MIGTLFQLLERKTGSSERALEAISAVREKLGLTGDALSEEQIAGLALCARGASLETVSKYLTWRDFEGFCSKILAAKGYRVRENIYLRKPRAQIDVLGVSESVSLAVDCKHWGRQLGRSKLSQLMDAQKRRARLLHQTLDTISPIVSVILVLVDSGERFVAGGAVVPIFAFTDFLDNLEAHVDYLEPV